MASSLLYKQTFEECRKELFPHRGRVLGCRVCNSEVATVLAWRNIVVITDRRSLKWLLSLKDPRERLARWVIEVQDHDFKVEHGAGPDLVVSDTLGRDAVPKPLCQRCYNPLDSSTLHRINSEREEKRVYKAAEEVMRCAEKVRAVQESGVIGNGPTKDELRSAQAEEFGNIHEYVRKGKQLMVDDDGIVRSTR